MKHVIYCNPYITLLYVLLQITCIPVETDKVSCTLPYWIHILPWLSMSLYATQCMNSAICAALDVVCVYLSTMVSELKQPISTLGYKLNGSHFACNIFNFIILVKPVFILHGAFYEVIIHMNIQLTIRQHKFNYQLFWCWRRNNWLLVIILYLLMPWLLKCPTHQQACYWLCRPDNKFCCLRVIFYLSQSQSKI